MSLQERSREDFFRLKRIKTRLEEEEEETVKVRRSQAETLDHIYVVQFLGNNISNFPIPYSRTYVIGAENEGVP